MKNIYNKIVLFLLFVLAFPPLGLNQDSISNEIHFQVNRIYPFVSITKEQLNQAQTLIELNRHYKSSWVKEYTSVEILVFYNGKKRKAISKNDILSQEQKDLMKMADAGTEIDIKVLYLPDNSLKYNEIKEMGFSLTIDAQREASFPGGQQVLNKYLKEKAMDKICTSSFRNYQLAAVKFTINEDGHIINAHVFESSRDEIIDELLVETICNMPRWIPAEYSNGIRAKQEFVLLIGSMQSCVINLLNIRQD